MEDKNPYVEGIISLAPKGINDYEGKKSIGFKLEGHGSWFNARGEEKELKEILPMLRKGNKVKFKQVLGNIEDLQVLEEAPEPKEDIINISGKPHMTYAGLLKRAHEKDKKFSMVITDSWVSEDMIRAWCKVRLTSGDGEQMFDGFGSSTPENTGSMTKTHPVEMAHTRAKGRALRDFLNIGEAMAEELKEGAK